MKTNEEPKKIVISLGGSLVIPNSINTLFLIEFKELITKHLEHGHEFIIVVGGGATARSYQKALRALDESDTSALDWMGIDATRLNARLVARAFGSSADGKIVKREEDLDEIKASVIICSGWKPGQSTDAVALQAAARIGADEVIILSDIDRIYTGDPKRDPEAKPLDEVSWEELKRLLPDSWNPGEHVPLDVEALRSGLENDTNVIFMAGKELSVLAKYLDTGEVEGTRIHT